MNSQPFRVHTGRRVSAAEVQRAVALDKAAHDELIAMIARCSDISILRRIGAKEDARASVRDAARARLQELAIA